MPILPLSDKNPLQYIRNGFCTWALIALCIFIFLYQLGLTNYVKYHFVHTFGIVPGALFGNIQAISSLPPWMTLFSHMFLHGGLMHLAGNMLLLWVLGDNIEDALGHGRYILFYGTCGVIAALTHSIADTSSSTPMIGASGAISGIIGAYLLLHPKAPIKTLIWFFIIELPTWAVLGVWVLFQLFSAIMATGGNDGGVAWWAHIGGLFAGMALIIPMRRNGVELFDRGVRIESIISGPRITMRSGPWSRRQ